MPWKEESVMCQRQRIIEFLLLPNVNVSHVCDQYNISRKTAYKWLNRYNDGGLKALKDVSRKRHTQSLQVPFEFEQLVIDTHKEYPYWGPRKLRDYLIHTKHVTNVPAHTTFSRILKRHDCQVITNNKSKPATSRFEREAPNDLWQMDFKGSFMAGKHRCYPLTILDDHSRYSIGLQACYDEKKETVKEHLIRIFKEYGLPSQINVDNGNPWGAADLKSYTSLQVWLFKLGIHLSHSSPYHPQTNGKGERFHRTLKLEVLHDKIYRDFEAVQTTFNSWQHNYNYERPHDALSGKPPSSRYITSSIKFPNKLAEPEYESDDVVRKVDSRGGMFRFKSKRYRVGRGFCNEYVAIRETADSEIYAVFFMDKLIKKINLNEGL